MGIKAVSNIQANDGTLYVSRMTGDSLYKPLCEPYTGTTKLTPVGGVVGITKSDCVYLVESPSIVSYSISAVSGTFYLIIKEPSGTQTFNSVTWVENIPPLFSGQKSYLLKFTKYSGVWYGEILDEVISDTENCSYIDSSNNIADEIASFSSGGMVCFDPADSGKTLTLTKNLTLPSGIILDASLVPGGLTLNLGAYTITCTGTAEIRGLKIKGSRTASGTTQVTFSNTGTLRFVNCIFDEVLTRKALIYSKGALYIKDCKFNACVTSSTTAGLIYSDTGGTYHIANSKFKSCSSSQVIVRGLGADSISRCEFTNCVASATNTTSDPSFRTVVRTTAGTLDVVSCKFTGSHTSHATYTKNYPICTVTDTGSSHKINVINCTITGNTGGVANVAGNVNLYNSIVCDNGTDNIYGSVNNAGAKSILTAGAFDSDYQPVGAALASGTLSYINTALYNADLSGYKRASATIDMGCYEHTRSKTSLPNNDTISSLFNGSISKRNNEIIGLGISDTDVLLNDNDSIVDISTTGSVMIRLPYVGDSVVDREIVEFDAVFRNTSACSTVFYERSGLSEVPFIGNAVTDFAANTIYFMKFRNVFTGTGRKWAAQLIGSVPK